VDQTDSIETVLTTNKGDEAMNEVISKAVLSGLGFASLTGDAIRETARDLVKQSRLTEDEGKRVVKNFQRRLAKAQKTLETNVNSAVRKALKRLDLQPARNGRIAKGSAKRNSHRGRKHAARAATAH
jgi:polyhydroxyalkanoate synthesis regulator phasin